MDSVEVTLVPTDKAMSLVDLGKRLLESAKFGNTDEVRQLMTNGAPFTTDQLGTSPLHLVAQYGHLTTAEVLIRAGISRDARTKVDRTPLHIAAQEGHLPIVELLLKNGADIEAKDMLKMTPLHWAVERAHVHVIESLLRHGADVNSMSKFEKTAIDVAIDNGRTDIVEILQYADKFREEGPLSSEGEATVESVKEKESETSTIPLVGQQEEVQTSMEAIKASPVRPVLLHTNLANVAKVISKDILTDDESPDQSSTSVLATLAALAEATAPLAAHAATTNASAAEALQWLETHGITMLPSDNSTIVASALDSGQTIALTEAGKLALSWTKKGAAHLQTVETDSVVEGTIQNVVGGVSGQKVITIVTDQSQLPALGVGTGTPIIVTMSNSNISPTETVTTTQETENSEPVIKKVKKELEDTPSATDTDLAALDREQLERRFEEIQRKSEEYKELLKAKESEAEEYRRRLEAIAQQNTKV